MNELDEIIQGMTAGKLVKEILFKLEVGQPLGGTIVSTYCAALADKIQSAGSFDEKALMMRSAVSLIVSSQPDLDGEWVEDRSANVVATKTYLTADNMSKDAVMYLNHYKKDEQCVLTAGYASEGRNVLGSIVAPLTSQGLVSEVIAFIKEVELAVSQSHGMRVRSTAIDDNSESLSMAM